MESERVLREELAALAKKRAQLDAAGTCGHQLRVPRRLVEA